MEGGRSQHQEDPRRRNKFSFGLHAKISVGVVALKSNKTVGIQQLSARLPPYLFFCPQYQDLPSEGSLHGARIFLALGSSYLSARKILALERSQRQGQVQHFACKLNTENIWRQDDPPSRIFLALGSSSLHVNSPLVRELCVVLFGL